MQPARILRVHTTPGTLLRVHPIPGVGESKEVELGVCVYVSVCVKVCMCVRVCVGSGDIAHLFRTASKVCEYPLWGRKGERPREMLRSSE